MHVIRVSIPFQRNQCSRVHTNYIWFFIIPEWCNGNYRLRSFFLTTNSGLCRVLSKHQLLLYHPSQHAMRIYIFINGRIWNKIPHISFGWYSPYRTIPIIRMPIKWAPEKWAWTDRGHSRTIKILLYTKDPRFRTSPRNGGQWVFNFLFTDPPRGRPIGAAAIIVPDG